MLLSAAVLAAPATAQAPITFGKGTIAITTKTKRLLRTVEVARTPEQHQRGLMFRRYLAPNRGMLFVFSETSRGGFWMKNTLIPLSIAFYDARGRILRIMQMEPCTADPCPTYDPDVAYRGALEVNKGAFGRWGVRRGDTIKLLRR